MENLSCQVDITDVDNFLPAEMRSEAGVTDNTSNGRNEETKVEQKYVKDDSEPLELPVFSTGVKNALSDGKSAEVWSQMLDELLMFFSRKYPNRLNCSEEYQTVGRMMFSAYPTIGRFRTHPWVRTEKYFA